MNTIKHNKQQIKADLVARGITQTEIAKMLNVSVPIVNQVISGDRKSSRIRKAISMAIGKPVSELWPDNLLKSKSPA